MTSATIRVRRARDDDAEGIAEAHVAAIRGLAASHYDARQIAAWSAGKEPARYREAMAGGERLFVAEQGDVIVGFAGAFGDELRAVYVRPEVARQGVGGRLLAAVEADARARGETGLRLDASLNAIAFYAGKGYVERARGTHRLRGGVEIACVCMAKTLA